MSCLTDSAASFLNLLALVQLQHRTLDGNDIIRYNTPMTNGPNKAVANFRRAFTDKSKRPVSDFTAWMVGQAMAGVRFDTVEEARAAFDAATEATEESNK